MDVIPEVVFIVRKEGSHFYFEFFNRAARDQWGLEDQAIGKTVCDIFSSELVDNLYRYYDKILKSTDTMVFKQEIESGRKNIEITLTPLLDYNDKYEYIVIVIKDISIEVKKQLQNENSLKRLEVAQSHYQSLFEHNTDAIFTMDLDGYILEGNEAVETLTGYQTKELQGCHFIKLFESEKHKESQQYFKMSVEGVFEDYRLNVIDKNDDTIGCLVKLIPIKVNNEMVGMFLFLKDMRVLDKLAEKYLESEINFRIIAENVQDVIILMNNKQQYVYVSPSSKEMFGFDFEEFNSLNNEEVFINIHPSHIAELEQKFNDSIVSGESYKVIVQALHLERGWIWTEIKGTPVFDEKGVYHRMVLMARDISLQKEYEEQLEFYAYHDSLTKLPNRRYFKQQVNYALERLENTGECFALMILDIDDFKDVNDGFGHEMGDEVIRTFGNRLNEIVSEFGVVARLGGDEFVILLERIGSKETVTPIVEKLQEHIAKTIYIDGEEFSITMSVGVTICTKPKKMDTTDILKNADIALYEVKRQGKSKYFINHS